jgi:hypothetical protein
VGIPTSQNPATLEGLESQLSVRIHRIQAELAHSTELERILIELSRSSYAEDSRQAEKSSGP